MRAAVALLLAALVLPALPCRAVEPGEPAPPLALADRSGQPHTLASLAGGEPLLVDFGSVFCVACRDVLEWLEGVRLRYGGRGLRVAAVNVDGPKYLKAIDSVCDGLGVGYPVLLDADGAAAEAYGVEVIPYLVLIAPDGVVRAVHRGRAPNLAEALGLEELVAEREVKR